MSASNPSIPSGGLLLDYSPPDPLEEGDDCAYDPHYFSPLADWHLKDMAKHRIVEVVVANLYVLGSRQKNAVPRQPRENQPTSALTKDDWFVNPEQVYLTLGETKSQGDAIYKSGRLVRIHVCPALVFITDEHYFPVLDLNTANPFAGMYQLVVGKGVGLPKTVGKLGKLLASTERKQAKGRCYSRRSLPRSRLSSRGCPWIRLLSPATSHTRGST